MNIDELLDDWNQKGQVAMANIGIAEAFFRKNYPRLQTSPEGYARAFDALSKPIPWKRLIEFEQSMMSDIIETTGLYAGAAGKTLCRTKRPTLSDWKTNTAKALEPAWASTQRSIMSTVLKSQLAPNQKLTVCKNGSASDWLNHPQLDALIALLPSQETMRMMQLPWSQKETETDAFKHLAQRSCPQMYPMLELLLSSSDWTSRAALAAGVAVIAKKKPLESLTLPEEFTP